MNAIGLFFLWHFEIGYDIQTDYITIPIRDELGNFVGVKGRYFGEPDERHTKYTYLEKCNKSKLLYGYSQNKLHIKNSSCIYIVESEKAVMQLAGMGIRNVVSTGGKTISKYQVELITRTGCSPIFAFDKDVEKEELLEIANKFIDGIDVNDISIHSLRKNCAYVPQDNFLFSDTIAENIAFASDSNDNDLIERAARLADVHDNIADFPEK